MGQVYPSIHTHWGNCFSTGDECERCSLPAGTSCAVYLSCLPVPFPVRISDNQARGTHPAPLSLVFLFSAVEEPKYVCHANNMAFKIIIIRHHFLLYCLLVYTAKCEAPESGHFPFVQLVYLYIVTCALHCCQTERLETCCVSISVVTDISYEEVYIVHPVQLGQVRSIIR